MIETTVWDPLRAIIIAVLAALMGSLLMFYVIRYDRDEMRWGAASATLLILGAIGVETTHIGQVHLHWWAWCFLAGGLAGLRAIWAARRSRRRRK